MTVDEKFEHIEEFFFKHFIIRGEGQSTNIPFAIKDFDTKIIEVCDGTINLAQYLTYLYMKWLYTDKSDIYTKEIDKALNVIERLAKVAYEIYDIDLYTGPYEEGFFIRDDITLNAVAGYQIRGAHTQFNFPTLEDPCFSSFVSQDQVWNLNPILAELARAGFRKAFHIGQSINGYIVDNNYTIYNPYVSNLLHWHTYCPTFNEKKVKPWERQGDRDSNYKPKVKVKRGANNWYYSGGTQAAYDTFLYGGARTRRLNLRQTLYKGIVFMLDRIYEPIYRLFTGNDFKHNSYYCYAVTSGIWYNKKFTKRFLKRFNKDLEYCIGTNEEPFEANIAPLAIPVKDVNLDVLREYLDGYVMPEAKGSVNSPLVALTLYYWYKWANEAR